jgi:hypothetical protein
MFIAWVCVIAICSLCIVITPVNLRVSAVSRGELPLYADIPKEKGRIFRIIFATVLLFFSRL